MNCIACGAPVVLDAFGRPRYVAPAAPNLARERLAALAHFLMLVEASIAGGQFDHIAVEARYQHAARAELQHLRELLGPQIAASKR